MRINDSSFEEEDVPLPQPGDMHMKLKKSSFPKRANQSNNRYIPSHFWHKSKGDLCELKAQLSSSPPSSSPPKENRVSGMGTPIGNCQAWGRCPGIVSPSHSYLQHFSQFDPFGNILIQQNKVLVRSSFDFCFMILLCNRVRELYIIKISFESRAWLSCYDLEKKRERIKRNKEIILILWRVMTSHIKSMMNKSC